MTAVSMPPIAQIQLPSGAKQAQSHQQQCSGSVTSTMTANNSLSSSKDNKAPAAEAKPADRHVHFKANVRVRKVSSHKTFTAEEKADAWWSPQESKEIRANAVETVKRLMKGIDVDGPEYEGIDCSRGLEFKAPKKNKVRQKKKQLVIWAVIDEQDRWAEDNGKESEDVLHLEEIKDRDNAVAEVYTERCTQCVTEAFSRGLKDAYIAAKCWEKSNS